MTQTFHFDSPDLQRASQLASLYASLLPPEVTAKLKIEAAYCNLFLEKKTINLFLLLSPTKYGLIHKYINPSTDELTPYTWNQITHDSAVSKLGLPNSSLSQFNEIKTSDVKITSINIAELHNITSAAFITRQLFPLCYAHADKVYASNTYSAEFEKSILELQPDTSSLVASITQAKQDIASKYQQIGRSYGTDQRKSIELYRENAYVLLTNVLAYITLLESINHKPELTESQIRLLSFARMAALPLNTIQVIEETVGSSLLDRKKSVITDYSYSEKLLKTIETYFFTTL